MSVIIKGMAMPETCYECRFREVEFEYPFLEHCIAHLNYIEDAGSGRLDTCPLEELHYCDCVAEKFGESDENWYTELDDPKIGERSED